MQTYDVMLDGNILINNYMYDVIMPLTNKDEIVTYEIRFFYFKLIIGTLF